MTFTSRSLCSTWTFCIFLASRRFSFWSVAHSIEILCTCSRMAFTHSEQCHSWSFQLKPVTKKILTHVMTEKKERRMAKYLMTLCLKYLEVPFTSCRPTHLPWNHSPHFTHSIINLKSVQKIIDGTSKAYFKFISNGMEA